MTDPTAATEAAIDFDHIKETLDNFDPVSLLPDLNKLMSALVPICRVIIMIAPITLLLQGLAYLLLSPKEANYHFGYRTYFGMGSVHAWRYTQRIAGAVLGLIGLVLTIVMYVTGKGYAAPQADLMVWSAVKCLVIEGVAAILGHLLINLIAMYCFNSKGDLRRKTARKKQAG